MGRSITFYKVDLSKVKSEFLSENELFKSKFCSQCNTWDSDYLLDYQVIFDKINSNPITLNPQEIEFLYYFTFNYYADYGSNSDSNDKIMEKYGFEELHCFDSRTTAEAFIQEFWNHFDPLEKKEYISPDYLITKDEFLDYLEWVCALTATFWLYEEKENIAIANDYLENYPKYKSKALIRYNYEISKRNCFEVGKDIQIFYEENKSIFDIIGHSDIFSNYFEIYGWFDFLAELRLKIINEDFENSIIYISDSY